MGNISDVDNKSNEDSDKSRNETYRKVPTIDMLIESVVRITVAGCGGALVGAAWARGGRGVAASARGGRTQKSIASRDLTRSWAGACMAFASLLELSRLTSPTTYIIEALQEVVARSKDQEEVADNIPTYRYDRLTIRGIQTIGDYAIGGAAAGLAFRGPPSSATTSAIPANVSTKLHFPARLGFGVCLGLIAGVLQFGVDYVTEQLLEDMKEEEEHIENNDDEIASSSQQQMHSSQETGTGSKGSSEYNSSEIESEKSDDSFEIVDSKNSEEGKEKKKRRWFWFR